MFRPYWHRLTGVAVGLLCLAVAASAAADTIYLKNGRSIRTSDVRVEGDRVIFFQYGGKVVIPMALVDRIEEDPETGPAPTPTALPEEAAGQEAEETEAEEGQEEEETLPEQTREYWQEQLRDIEAEREELRDRLEELRREERAFLFSQRSTAETRTKIEQANERLAELDQEERELRARARRLGIPPGWLRLDPRSG